MNERVYEIKKPAFVFQHIQSGTQPGKSKIEISIRLII